jgi:hypothetical protein
MIFDWYLIFNLTEFLALNLVSRTISVQIEGIGEKDVLITRGNEVSLVFQDVILPVGFHEQNLFTQEGSEKTYGVFKDDDENVYLGIEVA